MYLNQGSQTEGERIKFKRNEKSEEICFANIFPEHPYVTFTDLKGKKIEGTGFEFNTHELYGKTEELKQSATDFINEKGRTIIK